MRVRCGRRARRVAAGEVALVALFGAVASVGSVTRAAVADCCFSALEWSADGSHLSFVAGTDGDARRLTLDVARGSIDCPEPQVHEPSWCEVGRRILFRDRFGVFEVRPEDPVGPPQLLVFLPEASRHFLRALGEDALGRLLLWTYDREAAEHCLWTLGPGGLERLPGQPTGPEALRFWQARNVARRFASAGGRFVRSVCLRRPGGSENICLEETPGSGGGHGSISFRLTLAVPPHVQVLATNAVPAGLAADADSSRVLIGLFEDVDAAGTSSMLCTWMLDWRQGQRLHAGALVSPVDVGTYHEAWVHWWGDERALWADAAGELLRLDRSAAAAVELVPLRSPPTAAVLYRVVALVTAQLAEAEAAARKLRAAGGEAGILATSEGYEVQAAVFASASEAAAHVVPLQRQGFVAAGVRASGPKDLGAGLDLATATAPDGRTAVVRNVEGPGGRFSEIWLVPPHGGASRLLASFATQAPQAWP